MVQGDRVICTNVAADNFQYFTNVKNLLTLKHLASLFLLEF